MNIVDELLQLEACYMLEKSAGQLDVTSKAVTGACRHSIEHIAAVKDLKQTVVKRSNNASCEV